MTLGERVKARRKKLRMDQKRLAKETDITQATISRIESGKVEQPRSEVVRKLASVLGVTVDYLVGKTDKMTPDDVLESDSKAMMIFRGYEKLSLEGKKQLQDFVKFLEKQEKDEGKSPK